MAALETRRPRGLAGRTSQRSRAAQPGAARRAGVEAIGLYLSTAPASEPLSTSEFKSHQRIDTSADDIYCDTLVKTARQYVEAVTWRALINQTWVLKLPAFPDVIWLPKPPTVSITSIAYIDTDGTSQTLGTSVYALDSTQEPARIVLKFGQNWPATRAQNEDAVTVTFVAGYGSSASSVPEPLRHAVRLLAGMLYENREAVAGGNMPLLPFALSAMLDAYTIRCPYLAEYA